MRIPLVKPSPERTRPAASVQAETVVAPRAGKAPMLGLAMLALCGVNAAQARPSLPDCFASTHEVGHAAVAETNDWPFRVLELVADEAKLRGETIVTRDDTRQRFLDYIARADNPLHALDQVQKALIAGSEFSRMRFNRDDESNGDFRHLDRFTEWFARRYPDQAGQARHLLETVRERTRAQLASLRPGSLDALIDRLCRSGRLEEAEIRQTLERFPLR